MPFLKNIFVWVNNVGEQMGFFLHQVNELISVTYTYHLYFLTLIPDLNTYYVSVIYT